MNILTAIHRTVLLHAGAYACLERDRPLLWAVCRQV